MSLGKALRHLRKTRNFTLAQLAERVDSHVGNLSRIERGQAKPSLSLLYKIAQAMEFELSEIFSVAESEQISPKTQKSQALNAIFVALLDHDQELLLEFAQLLQRRENKAEGEGKPDDPVIKSVGN